MSTGIEEVRSLNDPLLTYNYEVLINNPPSILDTNELFLRCVASSWPGSSIEDVMVSMKGHDVHYGGRRKFSGSWNTSLIEGTKANLIKGLAEWQNLVNDPVTGIRGKSTDYKRNALVSLLDADSSIVVSRRIYGIYPMDVPDIGLDDGSSEAMRLEVTWAYDYWEQV